MVGRQNNGDRAPPAARTPANRTDELAFLSLQGASALVQSKEISPVELTRACLDRIEALNPLLNAFITVTADTALAEARVAETEVRHGAWRGPLHGMPIALKDMIDTAGVRTTGASALFKDRIPPADAAAVLRLREAGAILLGKLNMQEFAYGGTSLPSRYGPVLNPWDLERVAGGSSGGSAAAVAAGLCFGALGTDTGGSIREPAAFCGVVGLKPTYGLASNRGVIPLAWSLDHIGPLARTVADASLILQAIAPCDPGESARRPLRIGVPRDFFYAGLHPQVQAAAHEALAVLLALGAEARDVRLEVSTDRTVFRAEAFAYHAEHICSTPELYLPETLAKLRLGADIDAQDYGRARRRLDELRLGMAEVFSTVDILVTPTTPVPAPRASDYPPTFEGVLELEGSSILRNTRPFNMYGIPTVTVPCGFVDGRLPIGLQIAGPAWREREVLSAAQAFEAATDWHKCRPPALNAG